MNNPRKIVIMGYSGAGKSTLARTLGEAYGLAVLHLDQVQWLPGWQSRPREEQRLLVGEFLDANEAWAIDGNYEKICEARRLEEAELIVELLFGPLACYHRARKRLRKYRGTSRPDMTEGCEEKIDLDFTLWLLLTGRTREKRAHFRSIAARYPEKTVVLRNQRQLDRFLTERRAELAAGAHSADPSQQNG